MEYLCRFAYVISGITMSATRIHINPNILIWAIERVGKTVDEYIEENPKFQYWLDGSKLPTFKNVEQFAHKFYVPLGYMFLDNPPEETCPIPFFRSIDDKAHNINVYDTIKEMQERQEWLSDYLKKSGFDKVGYVGTFTPHDKIQSVCDRIREILNLPYNWAFGYNQIDSALKHITGRIEDCGTIVSFNSVAGFNNTRPLPVKDCRGFALIDDYAPFIFVNSKDAKVAQMFTLIHEFAHVLTGYSAGVGEAETESLSETERFCDKVAANFLVPDLLLKEEWDSGLGENYEVLSKKFKVSRFVIARRAMELGFISNARYFYCIKKWKNEALQDVAKSASGGNFYLSAIKKSSRTFLAHVNNALNRDMLLHMDAYRLTGLKGDTFHKILNSSSFV